VSTPVYQLLFYGGTIPDGDTQTVSLPAGYRNRVDAITVVCSDEVSSFTVEFESGITGAHFLDLFNLEGPISYLTNPRLVMVDGDEIAIAAIGATVDVFMSGISLVLP